MDREEIRRKILFNNKKIEATLNPSIFVLQEEIERLIEENEYLRSICPHEFVNGECIICGKPE